MKTLNKYFIILFLIFFSIPIVSCKHTDVDTTNTQWVTLPVSNFTCDEVLSHKSFDSWANSACTAVGMKYIGQTRCEDDVVEVLCSDL